MRAIMDFAAANALVLAGIYVGFRFHDEVGKVLSTVENLAAWAWSKVHPG